MPARGAREPPPAQHRARARQAGRGGRRAARRTLRQGAPVRGRGARRSRNRPDCRRCSARARRSTCASSTQAEALLARPDAGVPSLTVPRLMLEADMALAQDQPGVALEQARGAQARSRLAYGGAAARGARAHRGAALRRDPADRRPAREAQGLRRGAGRPAARDRARGGAHRVSRTMPNGLRAYWNRLSETDRTQSEGGARRRRPHSWRSAAIARPRRSSCASLERTWDADLAVLYAQCQHRATRRGSSRPPSAGSPSHDQDATLLYALGRLCERESLWGKAQTYLEASLALDDHWRTHLALGELHAPPRAQRSREHASRRRAQAVAGRARTAATLIRRRHLGGLGRPLRLSSNTTIGSSR